MSYKKINISTVVCHSYGKGESRRADRMSIKLYKRALKELYTSTVMVSARHGVKEKFVDDFSD